MSYSITFMNVPEEEMKEFNVGYRGTDMDIMKYDIIESVMYGRENFTNINEFIKHIKFYVKMIVLDKVDEAKQDTYNWWLKDESEYNEGPGTFTFTGCMFSSFGDEDNKDLIEYTVDNLFKYGRLVKTPDHWEETERWDEFYTNIIDILDNLVESAYGNTITKIKTKLYKYSDEYAEENKELINL